MVDMNREDAGSEERRLSQKFAKKINIKIFAFSLRPWRLGGEMFVFAVRSSVVRVSTLSQ